MTHLHRGNRDTAHLKSSYTFDKLNMVVAKRFLFSFQKYLIKGNVSRLVCLSTFRRCPVHFVYSLSDFLLRTISSRVIYTSWEMLDESNSLGDANLLLLCQLGGQSRLTGCRVVYRHMNLLLGQQKSRENLRKI